jgi:Bacterial Ig domain
VRTVRGTGSGAAGSGMRRAAAAVLSGLLLVALVIVPAASGRSAGRDASGAQPQAVADAYQTANVGTLAVRRRGGLLANDRGGSLQLISHTDPTHGSLTLKPDGAFEYVPAAGFVGDDTFTYTVANAVHLYTTHLPPLGTFGGVSLTAGGYGSSLYPVPGHPNEF